MKDAAEARTVAWVKDPRNGYNITPRPKAEAQSVNDAREAQGFERDVKWQDLVPGDHELWQGRKGRAFQKVFTIPEEKALEILQAIDYGDVVFPDEVKSRLAVGMKYQEVAIPKAVVKTLDNLSGETTHGAAKTPAEIQNAWKQWHLLSPGRAIKYNVRNLSGDAEATFVGNPRSFLRVPGAVRELYNYYRNGTMTPEFRDWFERGGLQSTLQAQEMGNLKGLDQLKGFFDRTQRTAVGAATDLVMAPFKAYWRAVRIPTDMRESILRYANYREYLQQMTERGGQPRNFGASIPEEVTGLEDSPHKRRVGGLQRLAWVAGAATTRGGGGPVGRWSGVESIEHPLLRRHPAAGPGAARTGAAAPPTDGHTPSGSGGAAGSLEAPPEGCQADCRGRLPGRTARPPSPGSGARLEGVHVRTLIERRAAGRVVEGRRARGTQPAFARHMSSCATARTRRSLSRGSGRDKRRLGSAGPSAARGDAGSGRRPPAGRSSR